MEFLISLILIYFTFRLISRFIMRFLLSKSRKSNENETFQGRDSETSRKRKKVFKKDDGEYIDFEEMNKK